MDQSQPKAADGKTTEQRNEAVKPAEGGAARFTVVMVTYNRAGLLGRALDSIVSQAGADCEVLVIDDGSTDGTQELVKGYGERVRFIRQEHGGAFAACRRAFHAARGRWLVFVDSDDRLRAGALGALRAAADRHEDAWLILGRVCSVGADGREVISEPLALDANPLVNFRRFVRGRLKAVIAGGLIDRRVIEPFDRDRAEYPHGVDLVVLGSALLHECVQIEAVTLDVIAHPERRLRNDIFSIHRSGVSLADMLFDPAVISGEGMRHRKTFVRFLQLERTRAYYLAGWHSEAWRSYARAVAASPGALLDKRNLRRAVVSFFCDKLGVAEGAMKCPPGHWLRGHGRMLWKDSVGFLRTCAQRYGPTVRLRLRPRTYLLGEAEDARHVLAGNPRGYGKAGIQREYPILAGGLLGAEPAKHGEMRRQFPVNFGRETFSGLMSMMVEATQRHIALWEGQSRVNVGLTARNLCTEIAGRVVLGCWDHERLGELNELLHGAHLCAARELRARVVRPWVVAPRWVPLRRRRRYARFHDRLTRWVQRQLEENVAAERDAVLTALGRTGGENGKRDGEAVGDSVLTIYLAMTEPVLTALGWALELLAKHPEVQERAAAEAARVFGARGPTAEEAAALPYTGMVVSEVLRLYPSEWLLTRRALAEDRLPSGLRVRRGEEVMISPYLLGHDPRFFPEPERFDPERFAGAATWPAGAYMPFGAGPRSCLGEHFARRELALMLALIVRRYRLEAIAGENGRLESPNLFTSQQMDSRVVVKVSRR